MTSSSALETLTVAELGELQDQLDRRVVVKLQLLARRHELLLELLELLKRDLAGE